MTKRAPRDHTATVPVEIYKASRGERRRIGLELAELRLRRQSALIDAARIRLAHPRDAQAEGLARTIEAAQRLPKVPLRLLACADCHRPTPLCACKDADGNRLDWAAAAD